MDVAEVLARAAMPKGEGGAKHGAATALPPAPWHTELFAQVHKRCCMGGVVGDCNFRFVGSILCLFLLLFLLLMTVVLVFMLLVTVRNYLESTLHTKLTLKRPLHPAYALASFLLLRRFFCFSRFCFFSIVFALRST